MASARLDPGLEGGALTSSLPAALAWLSGCTLHDLARACSVTPTEARRELGRLRIRPGADGFYRAPRPVKVSPQVVAAVRVVCDRGGPLHIREAARRAGYNEQAVRRALRVLGWTATGGHGSTWRAP